MSASAGSMQPQEGVIVFLDALGTRGSWKKEPKNTLSGWERYNDHIESYLATRLARAAITTNRYERGVFTVSSFSDTVIITGTSQSDQTIDELLLSTAIFLHTSAMDALISGIKFRGCISAGTFYKSKRMVIGPTVDEAAEYYDQPQWVGVSAAPSARLRLSALEAQDFPLSHLYLRYDIPLKDGQIEKNGWALNWTTNGSKLGSWTKKLREYYQETQGTIFAQKYKNTLDFLAYAVPRTAELKMQRR